MNTNFTRTITLAATIGITLAACGGSDAADSTAAVDGGTPAVESNSGSGDDALGGAGQWTNEQLCALSTAEAVSLAFGVAVEEQPARGDVDWSTCFWQLADDPLAQSPMSISNYSGFSSDRLGGDEELDIAGADMAAYSANIGGAVDISVVVGEQWLQINFPVGTEGAREFGVPIASLWAASQS